MFQTLFLRSLLPTRMLQMEDFLGGVSMIPLRGAQTQRPAARNEGGGLLSALSSYLMTPYAASSEVMPEATDADVENTLCTIDCISSCRLDELYSQIMYVGLFVSLVGVDERGTGILICRLLLRPSGLLRLWRTRGPWQG